MKKRLISIVAAALALLTVTLAISPAGEATLVSRWYGDIDCDNYVTVQDVMIALRVSIGVYPRNLNEMDKKAADIDADGTVTLTDARKILFLSAGVDTKTKMESYDFKPDVTRFLNLVNATRKDYNKDLSKLTTSNALCEVARKAAEEFAVKTGSALRRENGTTFNTILDENGYAYTVADKFICASTYSTDYAFDKMLETAQNKKALCSTQFTKFGVGAYSPDGKTFYWCVLLLGS